MQEHLLPSTDLPSSSPLDPLLHIFHPESTAILLKPRTEAVACLLRILQWLSIPPILKFKNPYGEKTHAVPWPCLWLPFLLPLPLVTEFRSHCRSSAPQTQDRTSKPSALNMLPPGLSPPPRHPSFRSTCNRAALPNFWPEMAHLRPCWSFLRALSICHVACLCIYFMCPPLKCKGHERREPCLSQSASASPFLQQWEPRRHQ